MRYQKSDSCYNDFYDRMTVERCRRHEKSFLNTEISEEKTKGYSRQEMEICKNAVKRMSMYFIKGEEYERKEKVITGWIKRDKEKDERIEKVEPIKVISCLKCGTKMHCTMKDLHERGELELTLLFYECHDCLSRRAFFEDGDEYRPRQKVCSNCGEEVETESTRKGDLLLMVHRCLNCGTTENEEMDFSHKKELIDKNFVRDRRKYCMTNDEGFEYLECISRLNSVNDIFEEGGGGDEKIEVKELKILQVEKIISKVIKKEGYQKFKLGEPEMGKYVAVGFTVYDENPKRCEYDSRMLLKKIINNSIQGSNWKLMSDGISCRVGILSGRLRCEQKSE